MMEKYCIFFFVVLFQVNLFAQKITLNGVVKDTNNALAYSSIEVLSKKKGMITDDSGKFTIEVDKTDTLLIKSLGYKNKYISNFTSNDISVLLEPDTFTLATITVQPKNQKLLEKGFTEKKPKSGYRSRPGSIIAHLIQYDDKLDNEQFLNDASIFIDNEDVVNTPIRIRCMSVSKEKLEPDKDIYKESIVLYPKKGGSWYKIDLSYLNVKIPEEGLFICFEYFQDNPKYYVESTMKNSDGTKKTYQSYGNTLGAYWSNESNMTWHKTIGDMWFQRLEKINNKTMNLAIKYSVRYWY